MRTIPLVFTFDSNQSFPASVCLSSVLMSAEADTFYDIYVLYSGAIPQIYGIDKIKAVYPNFSLQYRDVGNVFDNAFEIRGITKAAYYRLLAPELIPEYDKAIYADVDIIFRTDLSGVYVTDLRDNYVGAVYNSGITRGDKGRQYLNSIGVDPDNYFISGFLLMNLKKMREDNLPERFVVESHKKHFIYQDQDILNIVCKNKILALHRSVSMSVADFMIVVLGDRSLPEKYYNTSDNEALTKSNIHYNGMKPWIGLCPNFDIWWEYYRKSPVFDSKKYFAFFYNRLESLDQLSLKKRIKILVRYFVFGRKKTPIEETL